MVSREHAQQPLSAEEILFFAGYECERALYASVRDAILAHFDREIRIDVQKTQITLRMQRVLAIFSHPFRRVKSRPEHYIVLTLGLRRRAEHPLLEQCTQPYPGRFTHHFILTRGEQMDDSLLMLLDEAAANMRLPG